MQINIQGTETIGGIKRIFNDRFPYLYLVFFSQPHKEYKGSKAELIVKDEQFRLMNFASYKADGSISIAPEMSVWELEKQFEEQFGLHIQVFRKSGNTWLETSRTDDLSLQEQNERGRQSETPPIPIEDPIDYREQD